MFIAVAGDGHTPHFENMRQNCFASFRVRRIHGFAKNHARRRTGHDVL